MIPVVWSELAKADYWNNIKYLESDWTSKEVSNFLNKVDEVIELLRKGNVVFKPTIYKSTYQVVIYKQITLYYRISDNCIELLRFWNNYQDNKKFDL